MSTYGRTSRVPNTEKLITYLQKEQWQNVSANFSGFVKREFEETMKNLEEDEENFKNLRLLIDYAELGRYNDAKALLDPALKDFQDLESILQERDTFKHYSARHVKDNANHAKSRDIYTPNKRATDGNSPNKRENVPSTPKGVGDGYDQRRNIYSPKRDAVSPPTRDGLMPNSAGRRYHELSERSPRTPELGKNEQNTMNDPHRVNYDSLRLKSPEKGNNDSSRLNTPNERGTSGRSDLRSHGDQYASAGHNSGRNQGDKLKIGSSTYRQEFPEHAIDHYDRQDKNRYRENFGSATENEYMHHVESKNDFRDEYSETVLVGKDIRIQIDTRNEKLHRLQNTPDVDKRPSELARRFKEIYMNEWTEAYDEIAKEFGTEKTIRHLLWIVTEAYLIANDIADEQLRHLEQQSFSVMAGPKDECWLIALEIGDHQLRDLEKSTFSIMSMPASEHRQGGVHSRDLGEALPTSRHLLLKYRKQTAALSVPYVKEECRDKICRTLLEKSGFPRRYLTDASRVVAYIYKCAELMWLMTVQDPPIVLEYITKETEGARFNTDHYHSYTSSGPIFKYGVWPMLRLDKRGPIISKGIAQGGH